MEVFLREYDEEAILPLIKLVNHSLVDILDCTMPTCLPIASISVVVLGSSILTMVAAKHLGASPAERTMGRRRQPCSKAGYCERNAECSADCSRDAPPLQGARSRRGRGQDTESMGEMWWLRWSLVAVAQLPVAAVVGNGCAISFFLANGGDGS